MSNDFSQRRSEVLRRQLGILTPQEREAQALAAREAEAARAREAQRGRPLFQDAEEGR